MKRILIVLTIFVLSMSQVRAQQIVLGLNAGAATTRGWKKNVGYNDQFETRSKVNPIGTLRAGIARNSVEFGVTASLSRFTYTVDSRLNPAKTSFEPWQTPFKGYDTYVLAERALTIQFYLTKKFQIGKFEPYAGGAMGQGRFYIDQPMNERADYDSDVFYAFENTKTFNLTALIGCNYYISHRLAVNAEITGNYIIGYDIPADQYNHYRSIPLTAGIRYVLF